jgi:GH25 family lysozyme M1 (1,4-beta-N-acetylmuramidase)
VAAWGDDNGLVPTTQPKTDRWNRWTFWQYTSKARVPGVSSQVDDNIFSGTPAELAALAGVAPPPPPDPHTELLKNLLDGLGGRRAPK